MDLFNDRRRRVNLSGASSAGDESTQSRAALLEQARVQREARLREKRREGAATKIQSFWRSRHAHALVVEQLRTEWDRELIELAQTVPKQLAGVTCEQLTRFIAKFFLFARIARTRPTIPPTRVSPKNAALVTGDLTRFRHLIKILLTTYRHTNKQMHLGSTILIRPNTTEWPKQSPPNASGLPPTAYQWLYQTRKIASLLLEHIGSTSTYSMDHVNHEIMLLWLLLDSNQWSFVKDVNQSIPEERQLIQRCQALLVARLVAPIGQAQLSSTTPTTTSAAPSKSASSRSKTAGVRPERPIIDLFHCIRMRILDLTYLTQDGAPTAAQTQNKTSVALLFATLIRCMTVSSTHGTADSQSSVILSFIYYILSIPALPQRIRQLSLQALIPSFLTPTIWDRSLEMLMSQMRDLNLSNGSATTKAFSRSSFQSISYSWYDDVSAATESVHQIQDDAIEMDHDAASPPKLYSYFRDETNQAARGPRTISALAWIFGNLLEFVTQLDETKSETASRSFSYFLVASEQLIAAVPHRELPTLGVDPVDVAPASSPNSSSSSSSSSAALVTNQQFPPMFTKQFSIFGERSFLDRLCKRLLTEPTNATIAAPTPITASTSAPMEVDEQKSFTPPMPVSSPTPAATSNSLALNDVPIICALIDSILYRWSTSSNSILNTLVFSSDIVRRLWSSIQRSGLLDRIEAAGRGVSSVNLSPFPSSASSVSSSSSTFIQPTGSALAANPPSVEQIFSDRFFNLLPLFCTMYGHLLMILDDDEFFLKQKPFSLTTEVTPMVHMLKVLLYHLYWSNFTSEGTPARLRERFSKLFVQLRDRQSRKQFMRPEEWLYTVGSNSKQVIPIETLQSELMLHEETKMEAMDAGIGQISPPTRASTLLSSIPFVLPFNDRVQIFYSHIQLDKQRQREAGVMFDHGLGHRIKIRRKYVLEDSFKSLSGLPASSLKGRIQVEFTDEHGIVEAGLDGGGLFKEYLCTLLKTSFDPSYQLFSETPQHFIYPNPAALDAIETETMDENGFIMTAEETAAAHVRQTLQYFYFLGQMIGKALYDGIQIETQFALFFLRFCVGHNNYLDDLQGLDPVIHSNLMKLKAMKDDISQLGLTFSVDRQIFGITKSYDLIPNGSNIAVTNENKVRFLYLMSDYYLNKQILRTAQAFAQGMSTIINPAWLRMFAGEEIRLLISGSQSVNILDLQRHVHYAGGYSENHELIRWLWEVVKEFTDEEVAALLKFTTSCSRAPLLGFKQLSPQFGIQRVDVDANEQTLPTAATCMNLLRLPRYSTKQRLKEKLLYAVTSASHGFGLT